MSWKSKKNVTKSNHSKYIDFNSPDHSPLDNICSVMWQRVYMMLFIAEYQWTQKATGWSLEQNTVDTALNEWTMCLPACAYTDGLYFEYLLSAVAQLDN